MVSKYSRSPHIRASPNYCILQSAYQQGHSTEMAISKILDDIIGSIDSGHVVALVSLDISAAFNSVTHNVLVQRLEDEFGVTGTCGWWISDYLTGRSFTVRVGQSTSPSRPMMTGVPQGSVLGPLLYTIYVSPIGRLIASHSVEYHQYALLMIYNLHQDDDTIRHCLRQLTGLCRVIAVLVLGQWTAA